MDVRGEFKGKKVTLMGLGVLGRGIGDAKYLAEAGADLIVTDLKGEEALAASKAELAAFPNVAFVLGEHRLEDFRGRDLIVKAAGVPLDSVYIEEARKEGTPIAMSGALLAKLTKLSVVGVTGTRGKSTVTHMVDEIWRTAGKQTLLGGNIRGVSNLALLPAAHEGDTLVMELDSWQLQGFAEEKLSPNISVFTTFFPDHLNYYGGSLERYLEDKAQIFLNQKPGDTLVLGAQAKESVFAAYEGKIPGALVTADASTIPSDWTLRVPGEHNRYNAGLALAAARAAGIPDEVSRTALESFAGVAGRLELVRTVDGIEIYNDTNSTTPEATRAALSALAPRPVILIMGGADKNLSMDALVTEIQEKTKKVLLLAGTGTDRVKDSIQGEVYASLAEAFAEAMRSATAGDAVVMSPGFASFGMFKNEYDRGDQFAALAASYGA